VEIELFKYGAYLATGVVGWFVGIIWNRQEKQNDVISDLKVDRMESRIMEQEREFERTFIRKPE
jgi:hypothetical protein